MARVIRGFAEHSDLEKYYDIYDVSDFDMSDALRGFDETEFDDFESLRTLKILAARFQVLRKLFLCGLLALDANGDETDLLRWTTAVEALRSVNERTKSSFTRLQDILHEEECKQLSPSCLIRPQTDLDSIPHSAYSKEPFEPRKRTMAISDAQAQLLINGHPWSSGQITAPAGRIGSRTQ